MTNGRFTQKTFYTLPVVLQRTVLQLIYQQFHGSTTLLSFKHLEVVRHFILASRTGTKMAFGKNCIIECSYGKILCHALHVEPENKNRIPLRINGTTGFNHSKITTRVLLPLKKKSYCISYDIVKNEKLFVRSWHVGDSFVPLGMKGKKKLQDFFTDMKVPREKRKQIPIIVDEKDNILAVYNLRIDDRVKVTSRTKQALFIAVTPR